MKCKPHVEALLEVWNQLPLSEKSCYSSFSLLGARREQQENSEPVNRDNSKRVMNQRRELACTFDSSPTLEFARKIGKIYQIQYQALYLDLRFGHDLLIADTQSASDLGLLRKHRVHCVLSLEKGNNLFTYTGVKGGYRSIPIDGKEDGGIISVLLKICEFMEKKIEEGNLLVSCFSGRNKSCGVAVAFLMKKFSISYDEAVKIVKSAKSSCKIEENIKKQLKSNRWKDICSL